MAKEIEHKFLVVSDSYRAMSTRKHHIIQGYLSRNPSATVRIRIIDSSVAFLTIKGANNGAVRDEWEYKIPVTDAKSMLDRCASGTIIDKTRYIIDYNGHNWEVDEFGGTQKGLTIAEIELTSSDEKFETPPFVGEDVTGDPRFYNSMLK